jgi:AcrR family transcriptional regulator
MERFAARGYAATSVADIERAAGLTPRASGMYRHFPSKRAVLEAGIDDHVESLRALHAVDDARLDALPLREWLTLLGQVGVAQLADQRSLIRVLFRDLEPFPDLLDRVKEHLIRSGYRDFARRLAARQERGDVRADLDVDAAAAVAVGALVNHAVLTTVLDEPPAGIDEGRLVATWVDMVDAMVAS